MSNSRQWLALKAKEESLIKSINFIKGMVYHDGGNKREVYMKKTLIVLREYPLGQHYDYEFPEMILKADYYHISAMGEFGLMVCNEVDFRMSIRKILINLRNSLGFLKSGMNSAGREIQIVGYPFPCPESDRKEFHQIDLLISSLDDFVSHGCIDLMDHLPDFFRDGDLVAQAEDKNKLIALIQSALDELSVMPHLEKKEQTKTGLQVCENLKSAFDILSNSIEMSKKSHFIQKKIVLAFYSLVCIKQSKTKITLESSIGLAEHLLSLILEKLLEINVSD